MRSSVVFLGALSALLPLSVFAEADDQDNDVPQIVEALGVHETRFTVVPRAKPLEPPHVDAPVVAKAPLFSHENRTAGHGYLDPFLGREVFPELSATVRTGIVREKFANDEEAGGRDGRMSLASRIDLSLWVLDLRIPFRSAERFTEDPIELLLKVPIGFGQHRFAPLLVLHVPPHEGPGQTVVEAGLAYHYERSGFAMKVEASAFSGTHDRRARGQTAGMLGFNGVLSYLVDPHFGVVIEADGVTAMSEKRPEIPPEIGDTTLRLLPGVRIFPDGAGFQIGLAGLFTFVPDQYSLLRQQGFLFDIGYTFL